MMMNKKYILCFIIFIICMFVLYCASKKTKTVHQKTIVLCEPEYPQSPKGVNGIQK